MTKERQVELLELENYELRELVRAYSACHEHTDACRGCVEYPDCDALGIMRTLEPKLHIWFKSRFDDGRI